MLRNLTFLKILLPALFLSLLILPACNDENSKSGNTLNTENNQSSQKEKVISDSLFARAFEKLTRYDTSVIKVRDIEIEQEGTVKLATDSFYRYAKEKLRIDTGISSVPRLNLGVIFRGNRLRDWIIRMYDSTAVTVKIEFGVYHNNFLGSIGVRPSTPEYTSRDGRLMLILVAYGENDVFKGAYNLGGMQP